MITLCSNLWNIARRILARILRKQIDVLQKYPLFCHFLWVITAVYVKERPSGEAAFLPAKQEVTRCYQLLDKILIQNIVPFWYPGCIDTGNGGYRLNHDERGEWLGPSDKTIVAQARTLWFFSRLVNAGYGGHEHLEAAQHGFEFLRDHMWDRKYGGFYWSVDFTGRKPIMPNKHLYGQAFALYGLSEYMLASGDPEAEQLTRRFYHLLEEKAHDVRYGGYREACTRDWGLLPLGGMNYMGREANVKLLNTHLHLMEAFTAYYQNTKDPVARDRLLELILIQSNSVVRKKIGACSNVYTLDWRPLVDGRHGRVCYGHDVENVWLLMEACDAVGFSNWPLVDLYRTLFDYALGFGFDHDRGGFYHSGPLNEPADDLRKDKWSQAEGLISALRMYELTGEEIYWKIFSKTLDWINNYQVDWENGAWHTWIHEDGFRSGYKAGAQRTSYHQGRAVMECLKTLSFVSKELYNE